MTLTGLWRLRSALAGRQSARYTADEVAAGLSPVLAETLDPARRQAVLDCAARPSEWRLNDRGQPAAHRAA